MNPTHIHNSRAAAVAAAVLALLVAAAPASAANQAESLAAAASGDSQRNASPSRPAADRDELRIRGLHDKLKITPAQEPLWTEVAEVMRPNDDRMDVLAKARHERFTSMTAVEDLRSYGEVSEAHALGMKALVPAFEKLYDSMSAEQKSNADGVFHRVGRKTSRKGM